MRPSSGGGGGGAAASPQVQETYGDDLSTVNYVDMDFELQHCGGGDNSGGSGAEQANSAAVTVKQFSIDVLPTHVAIDPAGGKNGHRRAQATRTSCSQSDIATRTQAITAACCDEAGEDCSGGLPRNCNADCADTLMPFWEECQADLGAERAERTTAARAREGARTVASDVVAEDPGVPLNVRLVLGLEVRPLVVGLHR